MLWRLRMRMLWWSLMLCLYGLKDSRGVWIWVGRLGISFSMIPRFCTKLMIKNGARYGIRVSQFGPLVTTWAESR